jgi:speckle-type POZ protein
VEINLVKIGMEVEDVMYGIQGSGTGPAIMKPMKKENIGYCENLTYLKLYLTRRLLEVARLRFEL